MLFWPVGERIHWFDGVLAVVAVLVLGGVVLIGVGRLLVGLLLLVLAQFFPVKKVV